jgi:hypothetical protein
VIFFGRARVLLTNDRAIVSSLPFDLALATATTEMRIAVNETGHASAATHANFEPLRFPSVHPRRNG